MAVGSIFSPQAAQNPLPMSTLNSIPERMPGNRRNAVTGLRGFLHHDYRTGQRQMANRA
jgi:hypothetical protein